MQVNADEPGSLTIGDDLRVTRAGRFFCADISPMNRRNCSTLSRGEMSLVGPRPEVREYFEHYPPDAQQAMISLRPGITGPSLIVLFNESEILGRSPDPHRTYTSELIPIKARYIVQYAAHNSVSGDFKMILRTLRKVVSYWR
jgi:lipopolysaccharide/colanic/teichoic acid biosynthesis glycosyltransferase